MVYFFAFDLFDFVTLAKRDIFKNWLLFGLFTLISYRLFHPYAFLGIATPNPDYLNSLKTLLQLSAPNFIYPPTIQWLSTTKFVFPLFNMSFFGLGLAVSLFALYLFYLWVLSAPKTIARLTSFIIPPRNRIIFISIIWVCILFIYQSLQNTYNLRYYLPIYPFIALIITYFVTSLRLSPKIIIAFVVFHLSTVLLFLNVYAHPNPRVAASDWIYKNIPKDTRMTFEYWDDPLPLPNNNLTPLDYRVDQVDIYQPDTQEKWAAISKSINEHDYYLISSNRQWNSLTRLPEKFPLTTRFYRQLFAGTLALKPVAHFYLYPGIPLPFLGSCIFIGPSNYPGVNNRFIDLDHNCSNPGIYFRDALAEESFTVYDHPEVFIFRRVGEFKF